MNQLEKINYKGWPNSYRLSNGIVDLIFTTDVGPRLIHFGFVEAPNEFAEFAEMAGKMGDDEWLIYGGHRFWHAPEEKPRTYYPDNNPVVLKEVGDAILLIAPVETTTGMQKEIELRLNPAQAKVQVTHRLINHNLWTVECAPWALSVMAPGGTAVVPLPPKKTHEESLLPANTLTLWAYTDMADPRWTWGRNFVMLKQNTTAASPQKAGFYSTDGWVAYARNGHLFVKTFEPFPNQPYPDMNSTIELFTNNMMLEVETLGPVVKILPETAVTHIETWHLFPDVEQPKNENDVATDIMPIIKTIT